MPAGRVVNGELRIDLEAVIAEWKPRGENGPVRKALTFAESGKVPSVPGPLVRVAAGTPVRVTIRNTLAAPMRIFGLGDRSAAPAADAPEGPAFARATSMRIAPGATREVRFIPTAATTSWYQASLEAPPADDVEVGVFEGAYIIDPAGQAPPRGERVMMISTGFLDEDSPTFKMFINGESWPNTERLTYTLGDTVRWRVINTVGIAHPMHLHGFYFDVDARGDGSVDTVYAASKRARVVTDMMNGASTLRMHWVATEVGNWLFHCHLIRHMGGSQRYAAERAADSVRARATAATSAPHDHAEHDMAGLVMGITVRPRPGVTRVKEPVPTRRIDVWTGSRSGVYNEGPELAFVTQDGAVPAPDSTHVPGSTLRLRQGEPTRIMVHNRLTFPLSLHWHGLELKSDYDGVGGWSGDPSSPRRAIAPGDSMAVLITPPRAGTFMYHTHGEPGHELSQGLYGGFVVLPRGAPDDRVRDRLFMLASRGATFDAPPAINGQLQAPVERFAVGQPVRLRFGHISEDAIKRVRLLRDGEVVRWRLLAKDGAELSPSQRVDASAMFELGVGETRDVLWTPSAEGVYVLEVHTYNYPQNGGQTIQRVPFAVGTVSAAAIAAGIRGTDLPVVGLDAAALASYGALYADASSGTPSRAPRLRFFRSADGARLYADRAVPTDTALAQQYMIPLGDDRFAFGTFNAGVITAVHPTRRARFVRTNGDVSGVEVTDRGAVVAQMSRVVEPVLSVRDREQLIGTWSQPERRLSVQIAQDGGRFTALLFGTTHQLFIDSLTRLLAPSFDVGTELRLVREGEEIVAIDLRLGQDTVRLNRGR
ncbi:MAG: multicopper oxidase domain-containing protein [Gemmatimonadaceae bacterium]|nr:multicopper oxidase domain-containing protein [Gemmatimonadaceae bacterium]